MDEQAQQAQQAPRNNGDGHQSELALLSNGMVRLYKEQFGRGPTKVRTDYAGPDTVISTLENTLTPAEIKMREMGEGQRLEETRLLFQRACRDDFIGTVEEITGRKVHAFVSGQDAAQDVATEVFYLEPRG